MLVLLGKVDYIISWWQAIFLYVTYSDESGLIEVPFSVAKLWNEELAIIYRLMGRVF